MNTMPIPVTFDPRPVVVGSGIAGLTTALSLEGAVVVTAAGIGHGSTDLAQGGMAAALAPDDSVDSHASDTLDVGGGIVDPAIADMITRAGPDRIGWLRAVGAEFDAGSDGELLLGREAGHARRRIVHAGGDATGDEIMRALRVAILAREDIDVVGGSRLVDLVRSGNRIVGVLMIDATGSLVAMCAPAVVLATGGIGGVFRRSTNPVDLTGSGLAAAARQGATLADMEFVQFHPTALAAQDHPAKLISEAVRGEGATLIDEHGIRFMAKVHPDAELAPRDVVARAIWTHQARGHRVYLDAAGAIGMALPERFPTAYANAASLGIDARVEPMEISPAEHFHMGGIATDRDGRTSLSGLWAAGEVASTGLHGANRLASNSLLEGSVMGARVASSIAGDAIRIDESDLTVPADVVTRVTHGLHAEDRTVRDLAWRHLGIIRTGEGIDAALAGLGALEGPRTDARLVAELIAVAARDRTESRGAHHRADHPNVDPQQALRSFIEPDVAPLMALTPMRAMAS